MSNEMYIKLDEEAVAALKKIISLEGSDRSPEDTVKEVLLIELDHLEHMVELYQANAYAGEIDLSDAEY